MISKYRGEILATAALFGLDADLVNAQVLIESNENAYAWNPEPAYRYFWNVRTNMPFRPVTHIEIDAERPPSDFPCLAGDADQEWWAQQSSWGLMQIMGAVAREHGFKGPYLPELCDAVTNLRIGCEHLAALLKWSGGNVSQALAAYNGGKGGNSTLPFRNQSYADKVLLMKSKLVTP